MADSRHIVIPASGTLQHPDDQAVENGRFYLDVFNMDELKEHLNEVTMKNWLYCIDQALDKNGYTRADIDFLNMLLVKPSAFKCMLQELGLSEKQSVYNNTYGHVGEQDGIINIIEGENQGQLKDGDLMIIVAAGVGYVWDAACVKWGSAEA